MPLVFADNTSREIVTPNFGNGPYFDNQVCQVEIQGIVRGVKVEVTYYDMECPFDRITICDGRCIYVMMGTVLHNILANVYLGLYMGIRMV